MNLTKKNIPLTILFCVSILFILVVSVDVAARGQTSNYKTFAADKNLATFNAATIKNLAAFASTDRILVRFKNSMNSAQVATVFAKSGVRTLKRFKSVSGLHLIQVPKSRNILQVLAAYRSDPNVLYAEPDYAIEPYLIPDDVSFSQQWALDNSGVSGGIADADINAPEAWDITQGSNNVVVAVIDTGVDYTHEDLADNIWVNPNEIPGNNIDDDGNGYIDDIHGIDTVNNDSDPMDDVDHGTHVAGIIAAKGNNALGVAGVSWNTKVIACKIISNSSLSLKGVVSDAIECLDYIYDLKVNHGINIIATNNSWGWAGMASRALQEAIARQLEAGILFVAAAGNNAMDNNILPMYPTNYYLPNVISVAATTSFDDMAFFSSFGSRTVDVGAPGYEILSTIPGTTNIPAQNPFTSVYFNDVEGDQSQWQADAPWATWVSVAHGGTLSWTDSPTGPYDNNSDVSLTSPTIDLSSQSGLDLYLGFFAQIEVEPGFDSLNVEVSPDNGANWQVLDVISKINASWDFYHYAIPPSLLTNQFKFRFRLLSDSIINLNGVSIDDIGIGELPNGTNLASNQYASFSGTSMASPQVVGLLSLLKAQDPGRDWRQLKNLLFAGGTPLPVLQAVTVTGRRIRAANSDGTGSLNCDNQTVTRRLKPVKDSAEVSASSTLGLSVENINCAQPAGEVTITVAETGTKITLHDDGNGFDQSAGDGIYSSEIHVSDYGKDLVTLQFPDNSEVVASEIGEYGFSETDYHWRDIQSVQNKLDVSEGIMVSIDVPFYIPFADKQGEFNAVGVADGGYVILHNSTEPFNSVPSATNTLLPFSGYSDFYGFSNIVAPFWDDLMASGSDGVYWAILGSAPNRELVIEWRNVSHFQYGGNATFQAVFKENSSDIVFNYQDVFFGDVNADQGISATVGIQTTATSATSYSAFNPRVHNEQSLLWKTKTVSRDTAQVTKSGGDSGGGGLDGLALMFLLLMTVLNYRRRLCEKSMLWNKHRSLVES